MLKCQQQDNAKLVHSNGTRKHVVIKDTILVHIPKNMTADLGIAMRRCREKRLKKLRKFYPSLFSEKNSTSNAKHGEDSDTNSTKSINHNSETTEAKEKGNSKDVATKEKEKKNEGKNYAADSIPKREQFGSVVDYLEAKYVKGVMLADFDEKQQRKKEKKRKKAKLRNSNSKKTSQEDDTNNIDIDESSSSSSSEESDNRSCYSDDSGFVDDSLLRTAVAEQVMASSSYATTKVEAEKNKDNNDDDLSDDDGFFVNVGRLEMVEGYDETNVANINFDELVHKKKDKKKKRRQSKESNSGTHVAGSSSSVDKKNKKLVSAKEKKRSSENMQSSKKDDSTESTSSKKKSKKHKSENSSGSTKSVTQISSSSSKKGSKPKSDITLKVKQLKQRCDERKEVTEKLYKIVVKEVRQLTDEHLPKKKKKTEMIRLSITIPPNKKPGDQLTFANPRVPGQRMMIKVPKGKTSVIVNVPAPLENDEESEDEEDYTNQKKIPPNHNVNQLPKETKEALDNYSRAYDEWIDMLDKYHHVALEGNSKYRPNNEKLKKFDKLLPEFPTGLVCPINSSYLRMIVRRCRQNINKRKKSLVAITNVEGMTMSSSNVNKSTESNVSSSNSTGKKFTIYTKEDEKKDQKLSQPPKPKLILYVPSKGEKFHEILFEKDDFEVIS